MYERSAIILEKYYNNLFGFDQKVNLKIIFKDYNELVEEMKKYQTVLEQENEVIEKFDVVAGKISKIDKEQKEISEALTGLESKRNQLFETIDELPSAIEKKLLNIEESVDEYNSRLKELREEFVEAISDFADKQKERNSASKTRREEEKYYFTVIDNVKKDFEQIDRNIVLKLRAFSKSEDKGTERKTVELMLDNGKDEKIPFNKEVMEKAAKTRFEIARIEASCYAIVYEKMRRLFDEINNDDINLKKYEKTKIDTNVKFAFLKAEKMYIVSFLDNERMTLINGKEIHEKLMEDACEKYDSDIEQINNLYRLILREIAEKSSKKGYKELYNKEYLKNIEEKERNFEQEVNNIRIKTGTIINSNYWRIDEIKNIYEVFQKEVSENYNIDAEELKIEKLEDEEPQEETVETEPEVVDNSNDDIFKSTIGNDEIIEYFDDEENEDATSKKYSDLDDFLEDEKDNDLKDDFDDSNASNKDEESKEGIDEFLDIDDDLEEKEKSTNNDKNYTDENNEFENNESNDEDKDLYEDEEDFYDDELFDDDDDYDDEEEDYEEDDEENLSDEDDDFDYDDYDEDEESANNNIYDKKLNTENSYNKESSNRIKNDENRMKNIIDEMRKKNPKLSQKSEESNNKKEIENDKKGFFNRFFK